MVDLNRTLMMSTFSGAYSLVEPDGSVRVVEYWADDKHGFNAVVKRLGPNLHPTGVAHTPIYKAPIPVLSGLGEQIGPIAVGPVAKYYGLAAAPLLSGPIGGAISSASFYKGEPIIAPAPIIAAPIVKAAPIYSAPLPGPIYKSGPILPASYQPAPYLKSGYPLGLDLLGQGKGPLLAPIGDLGYGGLGKGIGEGYGYSGIGKGIGGLGYDGIGKGIGGFGYNGIGKGIGGLGYDGLGKGVVDLGYAGIGKGIGLGYDGIGKGIGDLGYGIYNKGPLIGDLGYGGIGKGYLPLRDLGQGLNEKGPLLSGYGGYLGYSDQGLKH